MQMVAKNLTKSWTSFSVRWGFPMDDSITSELDSAMVTIVNLDSRLKIDIYDYFSLTIGAKTFNYLVANYSFEQYSFTPEKYNLTISLVESTKLFEGIILPSRAFTNIRGNLTESQVINEILARYVVPIVGFNVSDIELPNPNRILPELVFDKPTLREFFDTIFSLDNCRLKLNIVSSSNEIRISYLSFNERKGPMPIENIDNIAYSNSGENYATNLITTVENAISQKSITEYVKLQSDDSFFTTKNAKIILAHPIYDIEKVVIKNIEYKIWTDDGHAIKSINADFDITKFIKIKEIYDSLSTLKYNTYISSNLGSDATNAGYYKNNCMYFEKGKNVIDGLMNYEESTSLFFSSDRPAVEYAYRRQGYIQGINKNAINEELNEFYYITWQSVAETYQNLIFEVTYKPYFDYKVDYSKNHAGSIHFETFNQANENADVNMFGLQSVNKLNQLGNEQIAFNGHCIDENAFNTFEVGMNYGDFTIVKLERTIHYNMICFVGILSKYYINENMYYLLDRQKRYYTMATNEFVVRHETLKNNLWFHLSGSIGTSSPLLTKKGEYATCKITTSQNKNEYAFNYAFIPILSYNGNQINYTIEFADSSNVGNFRNGLLEVDQQIEVMKNLKYVDDYGESESFELKIFEGVASPTNLCLKFPYVNTENLTYGVNLLDEFLLESRKDAREKMVLTLQNTIKVNSDFFPNVILADSIISIIDYAEGNICYKYVDEKITYGNINLIDVSGESFYPIAFNSLSPLKLTNNLDLNLNQNKKVVCFLKKNTGERIILFGINDWNGEYINIDSFEDE